MDYEVLNDLILSGKFEEAFEEAQVLTEEELVNFFFGYASDNVNILYYGFIAFMISKNNCSETHYSAAATLVMALCHIKGAEDLAFYHAKQAVKLCLEDVSYQEFLLLFYSMPDHFLPPAEALFFAKNILMHDPNSTAALSIVEELGGKWG